MGLHNICCGSPEIIVVHIFGKHRFFLFRLSGQILGIAPGSIHIIICSVQLHQIPCMRSVTDISDDCRTGNPQFFQQILRRIGISLTNGFMIQKNTDDVLVICGIFHIIHFVDELFKHIKRFFIITAFFRCIRQHPVRFLINRLLCLLLFFRCHAVFRGDFNGCDLIIPAVCHIGKLLQPEQITVIIPHRQICKLHLLHICGSNLYFLFPVYDRI